MRGLTQKGQSSIETLLAASFLIGFLSFFFVAALMLFQIIYWNKIAYDILLCHLNSSSAHQCTQRIFDEKLQPQLARWQLNVLKEKISFKQGRPQIELQIQLLGRLNYEIRKEIDPRVWK